MKDQESAWMTAKQKTPPIVWDSKSGLFRIRLTLPPVVPQTKAKGVKVIDVEMKPSVTYVVRIRKHGSESWGVGFETPLTTFRFTDLEPRTMYEVKMTVKNESGEGKPVYGVIRV